MLKVQIINKGHQPLPAFATPQSAGMDLNHTWKGRFLIMDFSWWF